LHSSDGDGTLTTGKVLRKPSPEHLDSARPNDGRADLFVYGRDTLKAREHFKAEQRGRCAICGRSDAFLVLDHEHSEMALCRGLLCSNCNSGLGFFLDHPEALAAASGYVRDHQERNDAYRETPDWAAREVRVSQVEFDENAGAARVARICALIDAGYTTAEVAKRFGLSVSQVNRIYARGAEG
jgi:hypothetical protein